jgi:hypothetical protein
VVSDNEKFAIAAHLSVILRRKIGRAIDTLWMIQNSEYAQEVLRIARDNADADIVRLIDRFESLMTSAGAASAPVSAAPAARQDAAIADKYIGRLR